MSTKRPYPRDQDIDRKILAKTRWRLLINVLINGKNRVDSSVSVRRFASFGLLNTEVTGYEESSSNSHDKEYSHSTAGENKKRIPVKRHIWYRYTCPGFPEYAAHIRHLDDSISIRDVLGFNNTGNVCVWPSEEILTYYCLKNQNKFRDKSVCELGGGMTCLAGVAVSICCDAKEVLLTDGNENSVENVDVIIAKNRVSVGQTATSASVLRWNEHDKLGSWAGKFDCVICADCLFFDDYRDDLVTVLWKLLRDKGEVIIFAPSRGDTFRQFRESAEERFTVTERQQYDDTVWALHQENQLKGTDVYDPNLHYPRMLHLAKECEEP